MDYNSKLNEKPSLDELMNQIYEWNRKRWIELKKHEQMEERLAVAKQEVRDLFY